jgi:translation initiation factor 1
MKRKKNNNGLVYSTDANFKIEEEEEEIETPLPQHQKLKVWLDTKHRGGKIATIITGFVGKENDAEQIGKLMKNYCGTGGSVKDFEIIIQGDNRDKIVQWLLKNGYTQSKKAGG